jgi:hypothetical protein
MKALLTTVALLLAAPAVFASADLKVTAEFPTAVIRAGFPSTDYFQVANAGPDAATNVVVTATSATPLTCNCPVTNIPAGQYRVFSVTLNAPATAGTITIDVNATSNTPDPDLSNNNIPLTLTVSDDPDVSIFTSAPTYQDLGLPFRFNIFLNNLTRTDAHDVNVTVDFRSDVAVQSLPPNCSSPAGGRIVCHLDTLAAQDTARQQPVITAMLLAPPEYGDGSIVFTANATERETDLNPASNTSRATTTLYDTFYVTTTGDDGKGSLRQAILDANANCHQVFPCAIAFRIDEPSPTPWKTIRVSSPLPVLLAQWIRIDGGTQTRFFGNTNPDGPEIEISGGGTVDGDGLVVTDCAVEVANLTINSFRRNGVSVIGLPSCPPSGGSSLHDLFIGTDATGSSARANSRGIGTTARMVTTISACVISGNTHSGIFGLSGTLNVSGNRIGVKAHADEPLPNGASGVFVGPGCYGSSIGVQGFVTSGGTPDAGANVIAFNGESGVSVATGVGEVDIRNNRIWGNALLGIDVGLDGPTPDGNAVIAIPVLTLAHFDPISGKTIIEGDLPRTISAFPPPAIEFYANDAGDPSGYGEGQHSLGSVSVTTQPHFHFEAPGDLTGQFVAATTTRFDYIGFAKPEGTDQGLLSQTSEFSRWLEVR